MYILQVGVPGGLFKCKPAPLKQHFYEFPQTVIRTCAVTMIYGEIIELGFMKPYLYSVTPIYRFLARGKISFLRILPVLFSHFM